MGKSGISTLRPVQTWRRRIVVVDDEPMTVALLVESLTASGFEVRTATDAAAGRAVVAAFDPDVAILDLALGRGPSGADLAHILHREHPDVALLVLTRLPDARAAGGGGGSVPLLPEGCGYLRKSMVTDGRAILDAIELVLSDQPQRVAADAEPERPFARLSSTQVAVLRMVAQGLTNTEIARRREVSIGSVEQMLNSIYRGLGIGSDAAVNPRTEAVRMFIAAAGLPERD